MPDQPTGRSWTPRARAARRTAPSSYRHPHEVPHASWRARLAAWRRRTFRPRQVILRSDDRVHALTLGAGVQQAAAGLAVLALLWSAGAGLALYWQSARIDGTAARLADAERAYAELVREVARARGQVVELADALDRKAPAPVPDGAPAAAESPGAQPLPQAIGRLQAALDGLAERNGRLSDRLAETRATLAALRLRAAELADQRSRADRRLAEARQALADARLDHGDLLARVGDLRGQLRSARARHQAGQQDRLAAELRVEALEARLAETERRLSAAERRRERLDTTLAASQAARAELLAERESLSAKVGRLERALGQSSGGGSLAERIAGLERALGAAEARGDRLAEQREQLKAEVARLRDTVEGLRARQTGLVERLSERATFGLDRIEHTVAMTGLDVDALVARVRKAHTGKGGPFVPAALELPGPSVADDDVRRLDRQMRRLAALQRALGALPLTAPVDSYWVSSHFGKRRDPVNGRWAMHEGLDLAATAGAPVVATAPGRVTFAGRKSGYGRLVEIDHGYGLKTRYGHLRSIRVEAGKQVGHRARIGALGSSGRSTGPHVHYEILVQGAPVDPGNFLKAGKHVFKN